MTIWEGQDAGVGMRGAGKNMKSQRVLLELNCENKHIYPQVGECHFWTTNVTKQNCKNNVFQRGFQIPSSFIGYRNTQARPQLTLLVEPVLPCQAGRIFVNSIDSAKEQQKQQTYRHIWKIIRIRSLLHKSTYNNTSVKMCIIWAVKLFK